LVEASPPMRRIRRLSRKRREMNELIEKMQGLAREWTEEFRSFKQDPSRVLGIEIAHEQLIEIRAQLIGNISPVTIITPACRATIACIEQLDRVFNDLLMSMQTQRLKGLVREVGRKEKSDDQR